MERIKYKNRHLKTVSLFAGAGGLDLGFLNAGFDGQMMLINMHMSRIDIIYLTILY